MAAKKTTASPTPAALGKRMAKDWDVRARRDPLHWTVNSVPENEWNVEDYLKTGEDTVKESIDQFAALVGLDLAGLKVVEIGCGAGRITTALSRRFGTIWGFDVSSVMIERARELVNQYGGDAVVNFQVGNGVDLKPLDSGTMDFATSVIVLQHIPDPELQCGYLREIARVLKPGGHFLVELYDNHEEYNILKPEWEIRRETNDLMGWSELTNVVLKSYETSICNPIPSDLLEKTLREAGLTVLMERGRSTSVFWLGGRKD
jgi:ubiquinone/menaquinone biosynthesis C-methylase UbiE